MGIFLTGATGYIGSYLAAALLEQHDDELNLLVRAKTRDEAHQRLWHSLQLHFDFPVFREYLSTRIRVFCGDLTSPRLGLSDEEYELLAATTNSVLHCAASLNRKSEKSCLNVNLRGTLEVIQLARRAHDAHGLRRFSEVSTVAVAGRRSNDLSGSRRHAVARWLIDISRGPGRCERTTIGGECGGCGCEPSSRRPGHHEDI